MQVYSCQHIDDDTISRNRFHKKFLHLRLLPPHDRSHKGNLYLIGEACVVEFYDQLPSGEIERQ